MNPVIFNCFVTGTSSQAHSAYVCFRGIIIGPLLSSVSPGPGHFKILLLDWVLGIRILPNLVPEPGG